ncbi:hypothetical protein Q3G72_017116 [Acer saccharum]|nr:hypothetical protein Q3G72_017116 [Acer saccharum]
MSEARAAPNSYGFLFLFPLEQNCRISYIFVRYTGLADPEIAGVSLVKYLPICGATRLLCLWDFQLNTNTNTRLGEQYHLKLSLATYARPLDIGWEPPEYLMLVGSTLTWMLSLRLADETPNTSLPKTLVWVPQGHTNASVIGYSAIPTSESALGGRCKQLSDLVSYKRYLLKLLVRGAATDNAPPPSACWVEWEALTHSYESANQLQLKVAIYAKKTGFIELVKIQHQLYEWKTSVTPFALLLALVR